MFLFIFFVLKISHFVRDDTGVGVRDDTGDEALEDIGDEALDDTWVEVREDIGDSTHRVNSSYSARSAFIASISA